MLPHLLTKKCNASGRSSGFYVTLPCTPQRFRGFGGGQGAGLDAMLGVAIHIKSKRINLCLHTYTHIYRYIYIYVYTCVRLCV